MDVEVEVVGQVGLQLACQVMLLRDMFSDLTLRDRRSRKTMSRARPRPFDAGLNVGCEQAGVCRRRFFTIEPALDELGDQVHYTPSLVVLFLGSTSALGRAGGKVSTFHQRSQAHEKGTHKGCPYRHWGRVRTRLRNLSVLATPNVVCTHRDWRR